MTDLKELIEFRFKRQIIKSFGQFFQIGAERQIVNPGLINIRRQGHPHKRGIYNGQLDPGPGTSRQLHCQIVKHQPFNVHILGEITARKIHQSTHNIKHINLRLGQSAIRHQNKT